MKRKINVVQVDDYEALEHHGNKLFTKEQIEEIMKA